MRSLCRESEIAAGYLPMVLSHKCALTDVALEKLLPHLALDASEQSFLRVLRSFCETESARDRSSLLERIQRFRNYRKKNPKELEVHRYLSHWYYVAIRELAYLPGFRAEPEWIQDRLLKKVSLGEIRKALTFLNENGFIEIQNDGSARIIEERRIDCLSGVFRVAMTNFHMEMLQLAQDSFDETTRTERNHWSHTVSIPIERFNQIQAILVKAIKEVENMGEAYSDETPDAVVQVQLAAFPLAWNGKKELKK